MNEWIKDNLLAVLAACSVLGGFLMTQYIKAEIERQLEAEDIVPTHKFDKIEDDVEENTKDIGEIEDRWNRLVDALAAENT
jgi:hypothetical protein